jgi:hypothetical protein
MISRMCLVNVACEDRRDPYKSENFVNLRSLQACRSEIRNMPRGPSTRSRTSCGIDTRSDARFPALP